MATIVTTKPTRQRVFLVIILFTLLFSFLDRINMSVLLADSTFLIDLGIKNDTVRMGLLMSVFLIPVFRAFEKGIGHGGTYHDPDGGAFGKVALAWLDWQLKGSKKAAKVFQGNQCSLCADPQWVTHKKKIK